MATSGRTGSGDKARAGARDGARDGGASSRQPSRWRRNLALLLVVVLGAWLAIAWRGLREEALVGTAYGARVGCVCRFVSARPLANCEGALKVAGLTGMGRLVSLSEDAATRTVRASVPLLASQSADFRAERGCQLEPWAE